MEFDAVIFDLDGVLADSGEEIRLAVLGLFSEFGLPAPSQDEISRVEALGSAEMIRRLLPEGKRGDPGLLDKMRSRFARISAERLARIPASPGALSALSWLKSSGKLSAIATNRGATAFDLVRGIGAAPYVDEMVTAADVERPKPDPEMLLCALSRLRVGAGRAVFVGDSDADETAGRAAGIKTVRYSKTDAGKVGPGYLRKLLESVESDA
jgi:HAD superfamily hydrolase (TIGR01509 family)